MLPTTIRSPPAADEYTPLAEYQSQTPESFVGGKPVLHFHLAGAKATIPKSHCGNLAIFPADSAGNEVNGTEEETVSRTVDVYVNSENFTIFSQETESGVSIPYPSISIHAVKQVPSGAENTTSSAVWMQLDFADGGDDDDTFNTVELTVIPATSSTPSDEATPSAASQMYEAIASCSNLHPDPNDDEDEDQEEGDFDRIVFEGSAEHEAIEGFSGVLRGAADGGLPPPMPGSGGWITAENVHEYFDEDGNWIGEGQQEDGEELGEGAGRTRPRDEVDAEAVNGGEDGDSAESKRPRVE